jgi:tetraacyldisaccharide 4'-kinase
MNRSSLNRWRLILIPFSWLYGLAVWIRNTLYDQGVIKPAEFSIPIISVGNITVGGTGKTPHVEYLVDLLKEEYNVATLSRGYRRRTRDFRLAGMDSAPAEVGDEPMQIKKKYPDVTVAVDRRRAHGVSELMKLEPPVEVVVLDDAFQHRSIRPGFSILLIDYHRLPDSDHLLPAGMLREPAGNRNRAHLILVTRTPGELKPIDMRNYVKNLGLRMGQHLYFTTVRYDCLVPVFSDVPAREADWYRSRTTSVLLVSGIADPHGIRHFAENISSRVQEITYSDHHRYTAKDMDRISRRFLELKEAGGEVLVLTTEKDAVKIREFTPCDELRISMHAVRIRIHFLNEDKENFDNKIHTYVTSNKRGSILHKEKD